MASTLGIGVGVPTVSPDELRINTKSPYDFVYWAGKFISSGVPSDYIEQGSETTGISLVSWALTQVGVGFTPQTFEAVETYLEPYRIGVEEAFRTRGAVLLCTTRVSISAGLDNIIDVVNGRHFMYKAIFTPQSANTCRRNWQYGALIPGLIYK